jgi:SAM-dependent MidA family methyltransferase
MEKDIGRDGDFFTSVSIGPLFGRLIATRCAAWAQDAAHADGGKFAIVEAGAHKGDLACDILSWFQTHRPDLLAHLTYIIVEPSIRRCEWQRRTLASLLLSHENLLRWKRDVTELEGIRGVILSNELLDSFPANRFRWEVPSGHWIEMGVGMENDTFVWKDLPRNAHAHTFVPPEITRQLENGFIFDTSAAAAGWWRNAARKLERGHLLTFDYGLTLEEMFLPHRNDGSIRAYLNHHLSNDVLNRAGEQDITAHVNFSELREAGENEGLATEFFGPQASFLTSIVADLSRNAPGATLSPSEIRQFQTLTHPEHLGNKFRVLVQRR